MELFKLEPGLFIWTWITFGFLFLILSRFVFPNLLDGLKAREKKISDAVDNAAKIEERLADLENEHKKMVAQANKQADEIIRKSRLDAEKVHQELVKKAEDEAKVILAEARAMIEQERKQLVISLRSEIADFVCDTSEKLISRSFIGDPEKEWTMDLVDKI